MLLDAYGEELDGEVHTDAVRFASAFVELYEATFPADRENLLTHNADAIDRARINPDAAKLFDSLEQTKPDSGNASTPPPPLVYAPVEPPLNAGKPVWSVWINLFRDELATVPPEELAAWGRAQEPVLSRNTREGTTHRTLARKALADALARQDTASGASGQSVGTPDEQWVAAFKMAIADMPNTLAGRLQLDALVDRDDTKLTMGRLQQDNPALFTQAKEAFLAKSRTLPVEDPR
jgi:hypothetical protein